MAKPDVPILVKVTKIELVGERRRGGIILIPDTPIDVRVS